MAKIRLCHVTNSSSSSFVIARKSDIKESDIVNLIIKKLSDYIKKELKSLDFYDLRYLDDELKVLIIQKDYDKAVKLIAEKLCDRLLDAYYEMELGDWEVHAEEFGNEDDFYSRLIYDYGDMIVSDDFKVG